MTEGEGFNGQLEAIALSHLFTRKNDIEYASSARLKGTKKISLTNIWFYANFVELWCELFC